MALAVARGTFQWTTAAATTTITISGLSFQPKAGLLWTNGRNATTDASGTANRRCSYGVFTSTTDRRAIGAASDDAQGAATVATLIRSDACLAYPTTAAGVDGLLDVSSIETDGVIFVIDDAGSVEVTVHYVFWGGDDLTNAACITFNSAAVTGDQDVTSLAFQPEAAIFLAARFFADPPQVSSDGHLSLGMATGPSNQWVLVEGADHGVADMATASYMRSDEVIALPDSANPDALFLRASFVSFLANGFRVNWAEASFGVRILGLALAGGRWQAGTVAAPTTLSGTVSATTNFLAKGVLVASAGRVEDTADTPSAHVHVSVGCALSTTDRACLGWSDEDAVADSDLYTWANFAAVYEHRDPTDGSLLGVVDLSGFSATQVTFIADDADSVAALLGYLAFSGDVDESAGEPPRPRRLHIHGVPLTADV